MYFAGKLSLEVAVGIAVAVGFAIYGAYSAAKSIWRRFRA